MRNLASMGLMVTAAVVVSASAGWAAPPAGMGAPEFIRGTIVKVSPAAVQIRTTAGKVEEVALSPTWNVQVTKAVTADLIKDGSFIGTAEMPQKDGTGRSLEVHVFPPGVKIGEGHYGWSLKPGSMMTNGTVGKVVSNGKGRAFDVSYPTGVRHIVVPAGVPIVQIVPGDRSAVRPGARVFIPAAHTATGLATQSIAVGENGAAPPM